MLIKSYEILKKDLNFLNSFLIYGENTGLKQDVIKSLIGLKEKKVSLIINSSKKINIASKNSKGDAQTNRISIEVSVKIILSENNFLTKSFSKSSIYTIIDRKSEQKLTENKLIENLSNEIALQIIFEILKNTK